MNLPFLDAGFATDPIVLMSGAVGLYLLYRLFFGSARYRAQKRAIESLQREIVQLKADAAEQQSQEHVVLELLGISMRSLVDGLGETDKQNIRKILSDAASEMVSGFEIPEDVKEDLRNTVVGEARAAIPEIVKAEAFEGAASRAVGDFALRYVSDLLSSNGITREMMEKEVYTAVRHSIAPAVVATQAFRDAATSLVKENAIAFVATLMARSDGETRGMLERAVYSHIRSCTNGEVVASPEFQAAARELTLEAARAHVRKIAPGILGRQLEEGGPLALKVEEALRSAIGQA